MADEGSGGWPRTPGEDPGLQGLPAPLGLDPAGVPRDKRYALTVDRSGIRLRAPEPAGVARGLTSLLQLIATSATTAAEATTAATTATSATLPALDTLDGPRFAWRGLTVDVVRRFFPPSQIRTLIDLAALYKLDVLHLHLTDDQGWRIEAGRPAAMSSSTGWTQAASARGPNSRPRPRSRPGSWRTTGAAAPTLSRLWPTACRPRRR